MFCSHPNSYFFSFKNSTFLCAGVPVSTLHDSINGNELKGKIVARVDDDANKAAVECN